MSDRILKPVTQVFNITISNLESIPEYKAEIDYVRSVIRAGPAAVTPWFFFKQYVHVVLCSYWKEQYARREWDRYFESGGDLSCISNARKRHAVLTVRMGYEEYFDGVLAAEDKFAYLETMPLIGPVTCRHLARNIGIDCVKPDRHMNRLAAEFGYGASNKVPEQIKITTKMCQDIQDDIGGAEYLGVIDVALWRACNLGWL